MIVTIAEYVTAHAAELSPRTWNALLRASDTGELESWTLARFFGAVSAGTITEVRNVGAAALDELRSLPSIEPIPPLPQCAHCREPILLFYDWVGAYCSHKCQRMARGKAQPAPKISRREVLPSARNQAILAARAGGETFRAIGQAYGISGARVKAICDRWKA